MAEFKAGEEYVLTGPVRTADGEHSGLAAGETVEILEDGPDSDGDVYVKGRESGKFQYVAATSLSPVGAGYVERVLNTRLQQIEGELKKAEEDHERAGQKVRVLTEERDQIKLYFSETAKPRVWVSVLDIPHGTRVKPADDPSQLYITANGGGWWVQPDDKLEDVVQSAGPDGWKISPYVSYGGPFTEVIDDSSAKPSPRVWQAFDEIPAGVSVIDRDGDRWSPGEIADEVETRREYGGRMNVWAPYTEDVS